jgi:hypothetical protein
MGFVPKGIYSEDLFELLQMELPMEWTQTLVLDWDRVDTQIKEIP